MSKFASLNVTAGKNPLQGDHFLDPPTPVFFDADAHKDDDPPSNFGLGTRFQLPTDSVKHANKASWMWLKAKAGCHITCTPQMILDLDVDAHAGDTAEIDIDIEDIGDTDGDLNGKDYTDGEKTSIAKTYDYYDETGDSFILATYTDLTATSGIDTFYVAPVITASVGQWTLNTLGTDQNGEPNNEAGAVFFWNDNVEFTVTWRFFHSGPGVDTGDPDTSIDPIPFEECTGPPTTDSGDNVKLPQIATTVFDKNNADYSIEYSFEISDNVEGTSENKQPTIRVFDPEMAGLGNGSLVTFSGNPTLQITDYAKARAPI